MLPTLLYETVKPLPKEQQTVLQETLCYIPSFYVTGKGDNVRSLKRSITLTGNITCVSSSGRLKEVCSYGYITFKKERFLAVNYNGSWQVVGKLTPKQEDNTVNWVLEPL